MGRVCNHINKLSMSSFAIVKLHMRVTNYVNTLVLEHLKSVTLEIQFNFAVTIAVLHGKSDLGTAL